MADRNHASMPLAGKTVLVTRPQGRADGLCHRIEAAGGTALHYPVIEILPPLDNSSLLAIKDRLHQYDIAIFISPTAVAQTASLLPLLPDHMDIAAIGSKTRAMLETHGVHVGIRPPGHDSEALLRHPALQLPAVTHKKILIFRGEGGRAYLGDMLGRRGAHVHYVESYRRALPDAPALDDAQLARLDAIAISSNEGLDNLMLLNADVSPLLDIPLIAPSDAAVINAEQYGFKRVLRAANATDEACMQSLIALFSPAG